MQDNLFERNVDPVDAIVERQTSILGELSPKERAWLDKHHTCLLYTSYGRTGNVMTAPRADASGEPCRVVVDQRFGHRMRVFVRSPLADKIAESRRAAGQQAARPAALTHAVAEAAHCAHQTRIFHTLRAQDHQHKKLSLIHIWPGTPPRPRSPIPSGHNDQRRRSPNARKARRVHRRAKARRWTAPVSYTHLSATPTKTLKPAPSSLSRRLWAPALSSYA